MQDEPSEHRTDGDLLSLPTTDFTSLHAAAKTYRMLGAKPVPLFRKPDEDETPVAGALTPGSVSGSRDDARSREAGASEQGCPKWKRAHGIGILTGKGGWNGLLVEPGELRSIVSDLHMEESAWVARNNTAALVYFRTDAAPETLRALAAVYQAGVRPSVTAGPDVSAFGISRKESPILPVPPSPCLQGGAGASSKSSPRLRRRSEHFELGPTRFRRKEEVM